MALLKKTVFLDRDGIINRNREDYVKKIEEFEILPDVPEAIRLLNLANYQVVIISNQSAVNRGLLTLDSLNQINKYLKNELIKHSAHINGIYYCPHRPDEYCNCRKPNPTLIQKAVKELGIDLGNSIMIGDRKSDMETARRVGVRFVLMETNGELLKVVKLILVNDD